VQLGFVIDHRACIGCHACTVACKAENDVPVGRFRTWVKYVETGRFPAVRRHFLVERCNHCTDAPCVTICPVNALIKRPDGIVDVDRDACIGCRACMQACPYDALYLDDDLGAVEKCHFCAHRIDLGLEPACVTVCPVGAIIPGDLHDPSSRAGQLARGEGAAVRRAEQETGPNVYYLGAEPVALRPGAARRPPAYLWSDRPPQKPEPWPTGLPLVPDATVALDVGHDIAWGWPIAAYLVAKGIAGGAAMLAPFAEALGLRGRGAAYLPETLGLGFGLLTGLLLVEDLARPWRFYRLLTRPNWHSWLVRGAVVLGVFVALMAAGIGLRLAGAQPAADALRWAGAGAGLGAAGYTAFLFAQCKGRDLWESRLVLPHLIVQALLGGSACLLPAAPTTAVKTVLVLAAIAHLVLALSERTRHHATENARQAAAFLEQVRVGALRAWRDGLILAVGGGLVLTLVLPQAVFVAVIGGLLLWEHAYVRAGQLPPLS
jgi:Fe-S-cluster-containing dehydrogenase component/formate-dependent nitrite reductase membrane component NrfD